MSGATTREQAAVTPRATTPRATVHIAAALLHPEAPAAASRGEP